MMEYDLTWFSGTLVIVAGFIAGFINTIAGGGSMLTLPALMMMGMPADIANATNRVGVLLQGIAGSHGYYRHGKLQLRDIAPLLAPALIGSLAGGLLASYLSPDLLKPALLLTMLGMAVLMLVAPSVVAPSPGTPVLALKDSPGAMFGLFIAGLYGGFVQAGVGFIILAALAGGLRYDLVRSNALKMAITAALTLIALAVFIVRDQVLWIPGLLLSAGTVVGASMSVKFAISVPQSVLKWFLFVMVLITCTAAWFS
jgi:hypothetical protein